MSWQPEELRKSVNCSDFLLGKHRVSMVVGELSNNVNTKIIRELPNMM